MWGPVFLVALSNVNKNMEKLKPIHLISIIRIAMLRNQLGQYQMVIVRIHFNKHKIKFTFANF